MSASAIISAAGSALSGLSSVISGIGAVKRQKKIIDYQTSAQKDLMTFQNDLQKQNTADERAYNEDWTQRYEQSRYENYDSLQAQVRDAKAAGLAPEAVVGGASSGASQASSPDGPGGVSVPGSPHMDDSRSAEKIVAGLGEMAQLASVYDTEMHNAKMRKADEEARALELKMKEEEFQEKAYRNKILKNAVDRLGFTNGKEDWLHQRDMEAWDLDRRQKALSMNISAEEHSWNRARFGNEKSRWTNENNLLGEQVRDLKWRNDFRANNGRDPMKSFSLGDTIMTALFGDDNQGTNSLFDWKPGSRNGALFGNFKKIPGSFISPMYWLMWLLSNGASSDK